MRTRHHPRNDRTKRYDWVPVSGVFSFVHFARNKYLLNSLLASYCCITCNYVQTYTEFDFLSKAAVASLKYQLLV